MGFHYFQALEYSSNSNTATFYGDSGVPPIAQNGLYCSAAHVTIAGDTCRPRPDAIMPTRKRKRRFDALMRVAATC